MVELVERTPKLHVKNRTQTANARAAIRTAPVPDGDQKSINVPDTSQMAKEILMKAVQVVAAMVTLTSLQCSQNGLAKEKYWFDTAFDSVCYYTVDITKGSKTLTDWQGCVDGMVASVKRQARNREELARLLKAQDAAVSAVSAEYSTVDKALGLFTSRRALEAQYPGLFGSGVDETDKLLDEAVAVREKITRRLKDKKEREKIRQSAWQQYLVDRKFQN